MRVEVSIDSKKGKDCTNREEASFCVMRYSSRLQDHIRGVHSKKKKHQKNFEIQNEIRIKFGPTFHFRQSESSNSQNISSEPKKYYS